MARYDLSVIIVSYCVREHLERCLASLTENRPALSVEFIVIDNASSDGSAELVSRRFPQVTLVKNAENVGFARANNQGIREANGRYWLFLNPDTTVRSGTPNPLDELVRFMDRNPHAGACGPKLVYPDGSFQHSAFHFPSLTQVYFDLYPPYWRLADSRLNGRYPRRLYAAGKPFRIDHPLGAALVVRPAAAEQVGAFDESYFIYSEEIDWCLRIKRAGWEVWCVPSAVIVHYGAQSTIQFREEMFVELWKARLLYFAKNRSPMFNALVRWLVRISFSQRKRQAEEALRSGKDATGTAARISAYERVLRLAQGEGQRRS